MLVSPAPVRYTASNPWSATTLALMALNAPATIRPSRRATFSRNTCFVDLPIGASFIECIDAESFEPDLGGGDQLVPAGGLAHQEFAGLCGTFIDRRDTDILQFFAQIGLAQGIVELACQRVDHFLGHPGRRGQHVP